jgi:hypothetical protein
LPLLKLGSNKGFEPSGYSNDPDGSLTQEMVNRFSIQGSGLKNIESASYQGNYVFIWLYTRVTQWAMTGMPEVD